MRFGYADPPYFGCAVKHYGDQAAIYDTLEGHANLIRGLTTDFDGWAYSMTTNSLPDLLPLFPGRPPDDYRICAWAKPFASFKPGVKLAFTWEPIVIKSLRQERGMDPTVRDHVSCGITLRRGMSGAKPEGFCHWMFEALGMTPEDEFVDLFPGSGAVQRAYQQWRQHRTMPMFS